MTGGNEDMERREFLRVGALTILSSALAVYGVGCNDSPASKGQHSLEHRAGSVPQKYAHLETYRQPVHDFVDWYNERFAFSSPLEPSIVLAMIHVESGSPLHRCCKVPSYNQFFHDPLSMLHEGDPLFDHITNGNDAVRLIGDFQKYKGVPRAKRNPLTKSQVWDYSDFMRDGRFSAGDMLWLGLGGLVLKAAVFKNYDEIGEVKSYTIKPSDLDKNKKSFTLPTDRLAKKLRTAPSCIARYTPKVEPVPGTSVTYREVKYHPVRIVGWNDWKDACVRYGNGTAQYRERLDDVLREIA